MRHYLALFTLLTWCICWLSNFADIDNYFKEGSSKADTHSYTGQTIRQKRTPLEKTNICCITQHVSTHLIINCQCMY